VSEHRPVRRADLEVAAPDAAVALLGALLVRTWPTGERVLARIVETEAYDQDDPASHSYRGPRPRTAAMFGPAGVAYVYRSYGIHWCLNVSCGPDGHGAAVLLRAAAVEDGLEVVRARRPAARTDRDLLRGPGRLAEGLDVDAARHDGLDLLAGGTSDGAGEVQLVTDGAWTSSTADVHRGPRVGVSLAADVPWRFHLGVPEVSAYRRSPRAPSAGT
jgi:DNA-3-methyladenine glycosylase